MKCVVLLIVTAAESFTFIPSLRAFFHPKPNTMTLFIHRLRSVCVLTTLLVVFNSCKQQSGGKIPFNEERARTQIIPIAQGSQYSNNFVTLRDSVLPKLLRDSLFLEQRFNLPIAETF